MVMVVKPDLVKDGKEYVVRTVCVLYRLSSMALRVIA